MRFFKILLAFLFFTGISLADGVKGIILAAGKGARLDPLTKVISKPLLPVYDKPMIYYPLEILKSLGVNDILIITNEQDLPTFKKLLGDGKDMGVKISYEVQYVQKGIADAFLIGKKFIGSSNVVLILGDNIFLNEEFSKDMIENIDGATVFAKEVSDPERFGVVVLNKDGNPISLEEKPQDPKSNLAVTGIYIYDSSVVKKAERLKPSDRGELEITDINKMYLDEGKLKVIELTPKSLWIDAGTFNSLLDASNAVKEIRDKERAR